LKTKRVELPNDNKRIHKMWKRLTSFGQELFKVDYSNHFTFEKSGVVLSSLQYSTDLSKPIKRKKFARWNLCFPISWDLSFPEFIIMIIFCHCRKS